MVQKEQFVQKIPLYYKVIVWLIGIFLSTETVTILTSVFRILWYLILLASSNITSPSTQLKFSLPGFLIIVSLQSLTSLSLIIGNHISHLITLLTSTMCCKFSSVRYKEQLLPIVTLHFKVFPPLSIGLPSLLSFYGWSYLGLLGFIFCHCCLIFLFHVRWVSILFQRFLSALHTRNNTNNIFV